MIRQIFLLVISLTALLSAQSKCPDHYNPTWFEESSDELSLIIDEYFVDKNISFPAKKEQMLKIGMLENKHNRLQIPNSTKRYGEYTFPIRIGLWRYDIEKNHINTVHLLIKEPTRLSEIEAINTYNDLLGAYWGDYAVTGYEMTLLVEDSRIRHNDKYFELNVKIYGLKNDATNLDNTYADIQFRDYTKQVNGYIECKEKEDK